MADITFFMSSSLDLLNVLIPEETKVKETDSLQSQLWHCSVMEVEVLGNQLRRGLRWQGGMFL